jgi:DNA-binding response OmpR family regulator
LSTADPKPTSKTVLIVDDEPLVRQTMELELKRAGYDVMIAADGKEALLAIQKKVPDLIISDIMMPTLDGYAFCRKVKDNPRTRTVPFLFLSAKSSREDRIKGYLLGAHRYITKPTSKQDLLRAVDVRLKDASLAQGLMRQRSRLIKGDLTTVSVLSLMEFFYVGRWTGKLTLSKGEEQGEIVFKDAEVAGARLGRLHGEQALEQLLAWDDGRFQIDRYSL